MFQKISYFLLFIGVALSGTAQDYLVAPSSNPALFQTQEESSLGRKLTVQETNFRYLYDTLELPFIDDFSINHFPKRMTDDSDPRVTQDSIIYRILIGGQVVRNTVRYTKDSTYSYVIGTAGDTVSQQLNGPITIQVTDLSLVPPVYEDVEVFQAFNYYDTVGVASDSTQLVAAEYKQDSVVYYTVAPNPNDFYTDRFAYWNNSFAINPPSVGVVTFDGLDDFGQAYDFDNPITDLADQMTSVPINLSNSPDTNIFFSFYFEPTGLSINKPEGQDSLVLKFYDDNTKRWASVWNVTRDTNDSRTDTFYQVVVKVPEKFQSNAFRFRFENYANSSGGFDQWHIDYLHLDNDRTAELTVYEDIAFVRGAPSLLKDYYAMPYYHYINNPEIYVRDTVFALVTNNASIQAEVSRTLTIPDTTTNTLFYSFPSSPRFNFIDPGLFIPLEYLVDFEFPIEKVDSAGTFTSTFTVGSNINDFIRSNDTVVSKTVLDNYYAYDDGTAEAGYGVNDITPDPVEGFVSYMAVRFEIPFPDTLEGFRTYFLPQGFDITNQKFVLTVWNVASNGDPGNIIFQKPVNSAPFYSGIDGFIDYSFDTSIVVPTNFYIGLKAIGRRSLNIGYDLNTNTRDKIRFSQNDFNWSAPSAGIEDGSLMLRPVFRTRLFDVGIQDKGLLTEEIKVYPNPTSDVLYLQSTDESKIQGIQLFDLSGRIILESHFRNTLYVNFLDKGVYLLRFQGKDGSQVTKKIIVAK